MSVVKNVMCAVLASYIGLSSLDAQVSVKKGCGTKYVCSRAAAQKGLDSLCRDKNTFVEDAWMFYKGSLVDIGFGEDTLDVCLSPMALNALFSKFKRGDTIILYHIHPDSYKKNRFSPPSAIDILNHAKTRPFLDALGVVFIERMFDGRGCWEFDADKDLIRKINSGKDEQDKQYFRMYNLIVHNCLMHDLGTYSALRSSVNSSSIDKYILSMRNEGILLKFTPSPVPSHF